MSLVISVRLSGDGRYRQSEKLCNMVATWKNITGYRLKTLMRLSGHKEGPGEVREATQYSCFKGKSAVSQVRNVATQSSIINGLSEARTLCSVYFLAFIQ